VKADGLDAFVVSALDSLAWLFNIRGEDVEFSPLLLGYAVLTTDGRATLCVDLDKVSDEVRKHLGPQVTLAAYDTIGEVIAALPETVKTIGLDRDSASRWLHDRVTAAKKTAKAVTDPITAVKARKIAAELEGVRAAMSATAWRWCASWRGLPRSAEGRPHGNQRRGQARELSCRGQPLSRAEFSDHRRRGRQRRHRALSRHAGIECGDQGAHGAAAGLRRPVPRRHHGHHPHPGDRRRDPEQKHRFTLVLKGHIALATTSFVKGTTGSQLDVLARAPLWREGFDFDHGTGHGVGTFLGVHEGPQRISKVGNTVALEPGMLISNEPGYYKTGAYGIRIENLVIVRETRSAAKKKSRSMSSRPSRLPHRPPHDRARFADPG